MAFLDDLNRKLNQAGQKARGFSDSSRINSQINEEERKINGYYTQLGKLYVTLHTKDYAPEFEGIMSAIAESEARLKDMRTQLQMIKGVKKCSRCNADVPLNSAFCPSCGNEMPRPAEGQELVRCVSCGQFVQKNLRFCTYCGKPMNAVPVIEQPQPVSYGQPAPFGQPAPYGQPAYAPPVAPAPPEYVAPEVPVAPAPPEYVAPEVPVAPAPPEYVAPEVPVAPAPSEVAPPVSHIPEGFVHPAFDSSVVPAPQAPAYTPAAEPPAAPQPNNAQAYEPDFDLDQTIIVSDFEERMAQSKAQNENLNFDSFSIPGQANANQSEIICPQCGFSLPAGSIFCSECGFKIG